MANLEGLELYRTPIGDAQMPPLAKLQRLKRLKVSETRINGRDWGDLGGLSRLKELWLGGNEFDDRTTKAIATLPAVKLLSLGSAVVTDDGVDCLAGLDSLEYLRISGKAVHGRASTLRRLQGLVNLRALVLEITPSEDTNEALDQLRKALPKCDIDFEPLGSLAYPRPRSRAFPYPGSGIIIR
jgi:hypothetical protein